ncbi:SOS response-associated peptidase family protein [Psychroserpens sp. BH13MA-6]
MFYRLSNTSDLKGIERELGVKFRFPNLYEPNAVINGLVESNLPIITMEDSQTIDFSIWGLLPEDYEESWDTFQDVTNTLNTNVHDQNLSDDIYTNALDKRRCLIIVNGFFTTRLFKGKLHMHYVHLKNHSPFCLAGIYNKVVDGFITCSLLVTHATHKFDNIPNLGKLKPLIFKKKDYPIWLDRNHNLNDLKSLINHHDVYDFVYDPIKGPHDNIKDLRRTLDDGYDEINLRIS